MALIGGLVLAKKIDRSAAPQEADALLLEQEKENTP